MTERSPLVGDGDLVSPVSPPREDDGGRATGLAFGYVKNPENGVVELRVIGTWTHERGS